MVETHHTQLRLGGVRGHATALTAWLRTQGPWLFLCLLIGVAISLSRGQANWWDLRNYHIYNPWSLLHGRATTDLFAAGIQGYFSPYADVPYYLLSMVWLPGHPRIVAAFAGLPFGTLIFMTITLVRTVLPDAWFARPLERHVATAVIVAVAVTGASTWSQAISTSHGVFLAILVIGAMILLLGAFRTHADGLTLGKAAAIGALLGLAAGLKLTATLYAPASGLILLAACRDWRQMLRYGSAFFVAWLCVFLLTWGPWGWHVYGLTGNPFFPMFNDVFHSPYAAATGGRDTHGIPSGLLQWLFYPFFWLDNTHITVTLLHFRDARFAVGYFFGITTLVATLATSRKRSFAPHRILTALAGFWFIAYGTWLVIFSLLRYAIVLEIGAVVITCCAIIYFTHVWRHSRSAWVRWPILVGIALFLVFFAQVPNQGNVPFGDHTFAADAPSLENNPLVILANQPMGILAPLITRANPTSTFVGIPMCFTHNGWCRQGLYDYQLGLQMRAKVAQHDGSIYVARYANHNPAMPQLAAFGIRINDTDCLTMHTNRTPNVLICRATFDPSLIGPPPPKRLLRLAVHTQIMRPGFGVKAAWSKNSCTTASTPLGQLALTWSAPVNVKRVRITLQSSAHPSSPPRLFAAGSTTGTATTGYWAKAAQVFVFTDKSGQVLAKSSIRYKVCRPQSTEPTPK